MWSSLQKDVVIGSTLDVSFATRVGPARTDSEFTELTTELDLAYAQFNSVDGAKPENFALVDSLIYKILKAEKQIIHKLDKPNKEREAIYEGA